MEEVALNIRFARAADAQRIHELHLSSVRSLCAAHYEPDIVDGWLKDRSAQGYLRGIQSAALLVAETRSRIVGFCVGVCGEVVAVFVDPAHVGRGVGSALLERALSLAQDGHSGSVYLESTLNAVGFYRRFGFREVKRATVRRNQTDVPVVVMERISANLALEKDAHKSGALSSP